jgi:tetratricopeptide (TPR) repeat protein
MLEPGDGQNRRNLANLLVKQNHLAAAENEYDEMITADPNEFLSHLGFANLLAIESRMDEYLFQLNEANRLNPDDPEVLNNLAWALTTNRHSDMRDGPRAVMLAQHACELTRYQKTIFIGTLAAAYAEVGKFDDAIATAQRACDLAAKNGETGLLQKNQELLEQYRQHHAIRE